MRLAVCRILEVMFLVGFRPGWECQLYVRGTALVEMSGWVFLVGCRDELESLILAQNERWRHA